MADVEIKGLSELLAAMKQLPEEIKGKVLALAVLKQAQKIRGAAKDNLRGKTGFWTTGLTERAIRVFKDKQNSPERAIYKVGVSMNVKGPRKYKYKRAAGMRFWSSWTIPTAERTVENVNWPPFWWRFLEFGTSKMQAKPFLRPAFDNNVTACAESIKTDLAKAIDRAAAKLAKQ